MPVVIFFACLDLEQKSSFMDEHHLSILNCDMISGMDDLFFKRVLFEWIRNR